MGLFSIKSAKPKEPKQDSYEEKVKSQQAEEEKALFEEPEVQNTGEQENV